MPDPNAKIKAKPRFTYRPQFGLVVVCETESEQKKLYERLTSTGLKVKVVTV